MIEATLSRSTTFLVSITHLSRLSWKKDEKGYDNFLGFTESLWLIQVWQVLEVNHRQRVASNHAGLVSMLTSVVEEKQCINPCRHWTDRRIEADDLTGLPCLLKRHTVACKHVMIILKRWFPVNQGWWVQCSLRFDFFISQKFLGSYKTIVKLSLFLTIHPPWRSFRKDIHLSSICIPGKQIGTKSSIFIPLAHRDESGLALIASHCWGPNVVVLPV